MQFYQGAPAFAVEVRSENDYGPATEREIAAKRKDYFSAGTQVVWDVNLLSEDIVRVYRAGDPDKPIVYHRGETRMRNRPCPGDQCRWPIDKAQKKARPRPRNRPCFQSCAS